MTTNADTLPTVGCWEWVALPEHGIACLKARVAPEEPSSYLRATDLEAAESGGEWVLHFKVHPFNDDPATFVVVEAPRAPEAAVPASVGKGSQAVIATLLTIGEESFPALLEVVESPGAWPLTLGRDVVAGRFSVDPARESVTGAPKLAWSPTARRLREASA